MLFCIFKALLEGFAVMSQMLLMFEQVKATYACELTNNVDHKAYEKEGH